MDKEKGEFVVVIKEEEFKEIKEGVLLERVKLIILSYFKSESKKEEKKDVLFFDKIKVYIVEMCIFIFRVI